MVLNYISRTEEQAKELLLQYLSDNLPEMTDHTLGNPFIRMLHVWLALSEQINYYVDDSATEGFSQLARRYNSLVAHAISRNYRVRLSKPSTVDITFTVNITATEILTIPVNTKVTNENGTVNFWTTEVGTIPIGSKSVTVKAIQRDPSFSTTTITPTASVWQQFALSSNVVDGSIELTSSTGEVWTCVNNLVYSKTHRHIMSTVNIAGIPIIQFGDGVTGAIPPSGSPLSVKYYETLGLSGNLKAYTLTKASLTLSGYTLSVYNVNESSGGTGADGVIDVRDGIRRIVRTLGTAVSKADLITLSESVQGVQRAGVNVINGKPIEIYILPVGGGIASNDLKSTVKGYIDLNRCLGRNVEIKQAGVIRLSLSILVRLSSNFSEISKREEITAKLLDLYSYENQAISGSAELSDVFQVVENTTGVSSSEVLAMSVKPYARPLFSNIVPLAWTVSVNASASVTCRWVIRFQSPTVFSLFRNDEFVGSYSVGQTVSNTEISFSIAGTYSSGGSWEFYSYKGYGSVNLSEPSIIILESSDIQIQFA